MMTPQSRLRRLLRPLRVLPLSTVFPLPGPLVTAGFFIFRRLVRRSFLTHRHIKPADEVEDNFHLLHTLAQCKQNNNNRRKQSDFKHLTHIQEGWSFPINSSSNRTSITVRR